MEAVMMIVLFVLFSVVSERLDKKKCPPKPRAKSRTELPAKLPDLWPRQPVPTGQDDPLPFEIPELRNAPPSSGEACPEAAIIRQQEEESRILLEEQRQACERQRREQEQQIHAAEPPQQMVSSAKPWLPVLTPQAAQQAVVLAEILGRPKAYRR